MTTDDTSPPRTPAWAAFHEAMDATPAEGRSKCGCSCKCHVDEDKPEWPGDCAGCCEPGMNCDCGRALAAPAEGLVELRERIRTSDWRASTVLSLIDAALDGEPAMTTDDTHPLSAEDEARFRERSPGGSILRVWATLDAERARHAALVAAARDVVDWWFSPAEPGLTERIFALRAALDGEPR